MATPPAAVDRHRGEMRYPGIIVLDHGYDIPNFGRDRHDSMLEAPIEEYQRRVASVRAVMHTKNIDVLCVKNEDLRYLTGFHTIGDMEPQTLLLPLISRPIMVARLMECDLIDKYTWISQWWSNLDSGDASATFTKALSQATAGTATGTATATSAEPPSVPVVGMDLTQVSAKYYSDLQRQNPAVRWVDADALIETVRLAKTAVELDKIRAASAYTQIGMTAGLKAVHRGALLSDVYLAAFRALIVAGSEEPAYLPIVRCSDPAGHGQWEVGERYGAEGGSGLVFLELSGSEHGHHAPRMQTCYFTSRCPGPGPGPVHALPAWLQEAETLIRAVFAQCLPLMVPGARPCDIYAVASAIMNSNSFGATCSNRLGYTVGGTATNPTGNAGWGDACYSIGGSNTTPLRENQVFHLIPWFQVNEGLDTGPVGLSDAVIVTAAGGVRVGSYDLRIMALNDDGSEVTAANTDTGTTGTAGTAGSGDESACLYSDNTNGFHPDVLDAIVACNADTGSDLSYGYDAYTAAANDHLKRLFGADTDPYLVFTGTAANCLGMSALLRSHQVIVCTACAHIATDECGAPERTTGGKVIAIPTAEDGKLTIPMLKDTISQLIPGCVHRAQPGVVSITQPNEFGCLYTVHEIHTLSDYIHACGFLLHIDGARLNYASALTGVSLRGMTFDLGADVISFGATKHGCVGAEAVIFRTKNEVFPFMRKQCMQLASKSRFIGVQIDRWLTGDLYEHVAVQGHGMVRYLEAELAQVPGFTVSRHVQTNMLFFTTTPSIMAALNVNYKFLIFPKCPPEARLVTSFSTTRAQIDRFVAAAKRAAEAEAT